MLIELESFQIDDWARVSQQRAVSEPDLAQHQKVFLSCAGALYCFKLLIGCH